MVNGKNQAKRNVAGRLRVPTRKTLLVRRSSANRNNRLTRRSK